jgi:hypothetical protein
MKADSDDGNALIQKLRQQSIDNQEKNNLYVQRKTFENSQVRKKCVLKKMKDNFLKISA